MRNVSRLLSVALVLGLAGQALAEDKKLLPGLVQDGQKALASDEVQTGKQIAGELLNAASLFAELGFRKALLGRIQVAQAAAGSENTQLVVVGANLALEGLVAYGAIKIVRKIPIIGNVAKGTLVTVIYGTSAGIAAYLDTSNLHNTMRLSKVEATVLMLDLQNDIDAINAEIEAATGL